MYASRRKSQLARQPDLDDSQNLARHCSRLATDVTENGRRQGERDLRALAELLLDFEATRRRPQASTRSHTPHP